MWSHECPSTWSRWSVLSRRSFPMVSAILLLMGLSISILMLLRKRVTSTPVWSIGIAMTRSYKQTAKAHYREPQPLLSATIRILHYGKRADRVSHHGLVHGAPDVLDGLLN